MMTTQETPETHDSHEDDRVETTNHFLAWFALTHRDPSKMTADELHSLYAQSHEEIHDGVEEAHPNPEQN